jgi:AcrR family transcriptional regulator
VSLRDRKRERTQLELASTALRLFKQRGYAETTVDQIVEAAEYAQSTFFRHFATKEDIAFVGVSEFFAEFETAIRDLRPEVTPWDHIGTELVRACRGLGNWEPNIEGGLIRLWLSEPALDRKFRSLCVEWEQAIARAFAAHAGTDPATDVRSQLAARSMLAAAQTGFHVHVRTGAELADIVEQSLLLLGEGLAPATSRGRTPGTSR